MGLSDLEYVEETTRKKIGETDMIVTSLLDLDLGYGRILAIKKNVSNGLLLGFQHDLKNHTIAIHAEKPR
jgi:hypothetical protein